MVQVYVMSAFSKNNKGGNKAGVVLNRAELTVSHKMEIAKELGYSETAFVTDSEVADYRYTSRFALPVYEESGEAESYNVFKVIMVVRHAKDGKLYLYDLVNIKKETSNLFQS